MLPDFGDSVGDYSLTLAMFNRLLAVIRCTHEGLGKFFDILIINELGEKESWVKQVSVGPILGIERPLGFWINGDLFLVDAEKRLVLFDTGVEKVIKLELRGSTGIMEVVNYVESLVPINGRLEDADGQFARVNPWNFFPGPSSSDEEEEEEEDMEREASGSP
ncbi:F-box/kelch-repeat protein [Tripterygium wilfordii]|uniref:F-box/kelch-repeat protein n=1 Tax=Tripterygium wilfordii TaxID=458696 RepID=A0A7J7CQ38_TRIWF|nr:F-box/kelch-repeat protein [Tripterygium wilfordii]